VPLCPKGLQLRRVRAAVEPGLPSRLALGALVGIVVLAPWPFGAVQAPVLLALTVVALAAAGLALVSGALGGGLALPAVPLWPLGGFVALALLQIVPVPRALHAWLAPGSFAVWYPRDPVAAAVVGTGPHPVSVDPGTTLGAAALVAALGLLAALAAPALSRPGPAARGVGWIGATGFAMAAYAIVARARFGKLLYGSIPVQTVSPFGPFVNKNHFAGWVAMASLLVAGLAIGLADDSRARGRDWTTDRAASVVLAVVAALAMALAGVASLSRGGTIGLIAGATCLVGLRLFRGRARGGRAELLPTLALAGALGLALVALVPPEAHERMQSLSGASFRLETWRDSLRLAATSPLVGHGLGAFHDAYPRFKQDHGLLRVEHAENDYIETLAEGGLLGLCLAACGLVLLLRAWGSRAGGNPMVRGIGAGAMAGLVALCVKSVVDFDLRIPSNAALAALLAAAVAGAAGVRPLALRRGRALALAAGLALLLAAIVARPARPWIAAREEGRLAAAASSPAVRELRLERADRALSAVLRLRPALAEAWIMLAGARAGRGEVEQGKALARHAEALDPERPELREAARVLTGSRELRP
jgi:O-antigen ligase